MSYHPHKTTYADAKQVLIALATGGFEAKFAGGCVRDRLLGIAPKDFDIATTATPAQVMGVCATHHWKTIPTGIDHGTVTVVTPTGNCEVTTLRKDVRTDGRHAVVEFTGATFADDAARRDFTINAMFEDADGTVTDFHGGREDLKNLQLKFVGDPAQRIREDYLRILRFFRFWARFDLKPDLASLQAIEDHCSGLSKVSQERITTELWGIFDGIGTAEVVRSMQERGVLRVVLPEVLPMDHGIYLMLHDASHRLSHPLRSWAVLCLLMGITQYRTWDPDALQAFGKRLRWSEREIRTLTTLFSGWNFLGFCERQLAPAMDLVDFTELNGGEHSTTEFFAPLWFFCAEHAHDSVRKEALGWVMSVEAAWGPRRLTPLPITGKDVMELRPDLQGQAIGAALHALKIAFRNGDWETRQDGLSFLRKYTHITP